MKPSKIKQFVIQLVVAYVIIVVVKMLACMVFGEQLAVHSILASIETAQRKISGDKLFLLLLHHGTV